MTALCDKLHTRHTSEADKTHSAVLCFQEVWGNFFLLNGGPDFFLHLFQTSPFLLSPYQTIWVIKKMSAGWLPSKQLKQWGQARDFFSHADPAGVANTSAWVLWVLETFNTTAISDKYIWWTAIHRVGQEKGSQEKHFHEVFCYY